MIDTYTAERAGFAERAGKLAGSTTYREPVAGRTNKADHMPDAHAIAAAFAFAKQHRHDIRPDIAVAVNTGCQLRKKEVVTALAASILTLMQKAGEAEIKAIIHVSEDCFLRAIGMKGIGKPKNMEAKAFDALSRLGDSIILSASSEGTSMAARAYYGR